MAEGFARHYGSDVLLPASAGLAPVPGIARETVIVMRELNIDVSRHVPRRYEPIEAERSDIVVNIAGMRLPGRQPKRLLEWRVSDPYGFPVEEFRKVRDQLEQNVMRLILDLRKQAERGDIGVNLAPR